MLHTLPQQYESYVDWEVSRHYRIPLQPVWACCKLCPLSPVVGRETAERERGGTFTRRKIKMSRKCALKQFLELSFARPAAPCCWYLNKLPFQIWCVCCWARRPGPMWKKTGFRCHGALRLPWQPNPFCWTAVWSGIHPGSGKKNNRLDSEKCIHKIHKPRQDYLPAIVSSFNTWGCFYWHYKG